MNATDRIIEKTNRKPGLAAACLTSCRKLIGQIEKTKEAIFAEFRTLLEGDERLLRLALTEAEALAWQTEFPQLFFPTLAMEKAQAVAAWHGRQQSVQRANLQW